MKMWMFNCREVSKLVSQSMDSELSWIQKMGIRFHFLMCKYCARFSKQLHELRTTISASQSEQVERYKMDEQVKEKIKRVLASGKSP